MTEDADKALCADLLAYETRVWDALVSGDRQADEAALSDTFLGVYPDGFAGKDDHTGQLADGPTIQHFALTDYRARALGAGYAILSYRAVFRRCGKAADEVMFVSSIWQRQDGGWINVFSQDTPAADD